MGQKVPCPPRRYSPPYRIDPLNFQNVQPPGNIPLPNSTAPLISRIHTLSISPFLSTVRQFLIPLFEKRETSKK